MLRWLCPHCIPIVLASDFDRLRFYRLLLSSVFGPQCLAVVLSASFSHASCRHYNFAVGVYVLGEANCYGSRIACAVRVDHANRELSPFANGPVQRRILMRATK